MLTITVSVGFSFKNSAVSQSMSSKSSVPLDSSFSLRHSYKKMYRFEFVMTQYKPYIEDGTSSGQQLIFYGHILAAKYPRRRSGCESCRAVVSSGNTYH